MKDLSLFFKDSSRKDGYSYRCKDCQSKYYSKYKTKNRKKVLAKQKEWYLHNKIHKNQVSIKRKKCRVCEKTRIASKFHKVSKHGDGLARLCIDCQKIESRKYYLKNKEKIKAKNRAWERENKEKVAQSKRNWKKNNPGYATEYIRNNLQARIANNLRVRLRRAIKNNQKVGSAVRDLGCTIPELKTYLESMFQPGMNWDNYGDWHIDHIQPLSSFDLTDRKQLRIACNFRNLQPLWCVDNLSKGSEALAA